MDPFIAEIRVVPFTFAPKGWAFCNGQVLPIAQNTALFSLLGTTYGGDGVTTYALPNLQGRAPMHPGQGPGLSNYVLGEAGGASTVTLTTPQLPSHSHSLSIPAANGPATSTDPQGNLPASQAENAFSAQGTPVEMALSTVAPSYSGGPHNNLQPYLVVNFVIALQGVYPPRG